MEARRKNQRAAAKREATPKFVLVGTYKGDQLTDWRGWYNYPISDGDLSRVEHVERVDGRARSPSAPQSTGDYSRINELWLFKGTKDERRYKAEFVGVKTRENLTNEEPFADYDIGSHFDGRIKKLQEIIARLNAITGLQAA